jgi:hypothetical protein
MEIKLYNSPLRALKLFLLCSIFVGGGVYLLMKTHMLPLVGWLNIGFFGLGYPVSLYHLFDRRPQVIINELGIFDRSTYTGFINWEVIRDAYPLDIEEQKFICLLVDERYEPSLKKGKFERTLSRLKKELRAQELNISLSHISVDEKKLSSFIRKLIKATPNTRQPLLESAAF